MKKAAPAPVLELAGDERPVGAGGWRRRLLDWSLRHRPVPGADDRIVAGVVGDYLTDRIRVHGRYEADELAALDGLVLARLPALAAGTCVDVGANIGNHTLFFATRFRRVVAFEPNPLTHALLRWNVDANGLDGAVEVHPHGLSDANGTALIEVARANLGASRLDGGGGGTGGRRLPVSLVRGDDVLANEAAVTFVKIDVEGHELGALLGLERTLERHRPVVLMEQLLATAEPSTGCSAATRRLLESGYEAHEFVWVRRTRVRWLDSALASLRRTRRRSLRRVDRFERRDYPTLLFLQAPHVEALRRAQAGSGS